MTPLVFALAAAPGCHRKGREAVAQSPYNLVELGRELSISLPPSARVVGVEREEGMDDRIAAKLEIPQDDWPSVIASTPIKADAFDPGARGMLGQDHGFWDPHRAPGLRAAQAPLRGARYLNIGVSAPTNGVVAVYIVNHGT